MADEEPQKDANGRMSNFAIAEYVGGKIDTAKADIRREVRLYVGLGLVGGQVLAGAVAAFITRTTPAEAVRQAVAFFT
jgi:hypothetical protein